MSLVVDASAFAELLLRSDRGARVQDAIGHDHLLAPEHVVAEVLSAARGWVRSGKVTSDRASGALTDFDDLGVDLVALTPLTRAAWNLRDRASAYDAFYVVLAEALSVPLVTCDERLAREFPEIAVVP